MFFVVFFSIFFGEGVREFLLFFIFYFVFFLFWRIFCFILLFCFFSFSPVFLSCVFFSLSFFLFFFLLACLFVFSFFKTFFSVGQVKGNARNGRSRHQPTNQRFRVSRSVCLRHDALNGCHLENLNARLWSADGVTIGDEHTSTRITENESANRCQHRRIRTPITHIPPIITTVTRMTPSFSE